MVLVARSRGNSFLCLKDFPFIGISFWVSTSFLEKAAHESTTSCFSLLSGPLLFKGEGITFLNKDTKKANTVGLHGSPGGVPLRSAFKKELASELQQVKLVDSLQILKTMFFSLGSPNPWLNTVGVPRPGHFCLRWYPFKRQGLLWRSPWVGRGFVKCALRSQALLPYCAFFLFYRSKRKLSIKVLHSRVSESASQKTQLYPFPIPPPLLCFSVYLCVVSPCVCVSLCVYVSLSLSLSVYLCVSLCLSLSLSVCVSPYPSQTPCSKFTRKDFPPQVRGYIFSFTVRKGGSGRLLMAIHSVSFCNSILRETELIFLSHPFDSYVSCLNWFWAQGGKQSWFIFNSSMNRKKKKKLLHVIGIFEWFPGGHIGHFFYSFVMSSLKKSSSGKEKNTM